MRAAVVRELGKPPEFGEFEEPVSGPNESIARMSASAVNPLTLSRAGGVHYSARTSPPFVAGVDGVGRLDDGRRVYVARVRAPFGTLAERAPVAREMTVDLPPGLDAAFAAAIAIPGQSSWNPLTHRASIRAGESVLVHGATGAAGRMAIQIAKHLGARAVVATGRDRTKLATLGAVGADRTISLEQSPEAIRAAVFDAAKEFEIGVVVDYLWGATAVPVLAGLGGPDGPRGYAPVRYVQIGAIAGGTLPLDSAILRSSGLEILGSGLGSSPIAHMAESFRGLFAAAATGRFVLETDVRPLSEVTERWGATGGERRLVFSIS
jgi:NADPH:quinone reductase-like Zn-dependent oxidoreductase